MGVVHFFFSFHPIFPFFTSFYVLVVVFVVVILGNEGERASQLCPKEGTKVKGVEEKGEANN